MLSNKSNYTSSLILCILLLANKNHGMCRLYQNQICLLLENVAAALLVLIKILHVLSLIRGMIFSSL